MAMYCRLIEFSYLCSGDTVKQYYCQNTLISFSWDGIFCTCTNISQVIDAIWKVVVIIHRLESIAHHTSMNYACGHSHLADSMTCVTKLSFSPTVRMQVKYGFPCLWESWPFCLNSQLCTHWKDWAMLPVVMAVLTNGAGLELIL